MSDNNFYIAMAQIDARVGDFAWNAKRIIDAACLVASRGWGGGVLLTPEMSLMGYPAEDLVLRPGFCQSAQTELQKLAEKLVQEGVGDMRVLVGYPATSDGGKYIYNAVAVLQGGRIIQTYYKHHLPNYAVFDEQRYFTPGHQPAVLSVSGLGLGVLICEDIWGGTGLRDREQLPSAVDASLGAGADLLLVMNASPWHTGKYRRREHIIAQRAMQTGKPIIYCNRVGGQDELVFDGASFVIGESVGSVIRFPLFEECVGAVAIVSSEGQGGGGVQSISNLGYVSLPKPNSSRSFSFLPAGSKGGGGIDEDDEAEQYMGLQVGLRDYVEKNGFSDVLLGLSGGIDSALTLAIACDALGAKRVRAVMMPSSYTASISWIDARAMSVGLGVEYHEISIGSLLERAQEQLHPILAGKEQGGVVEENLQARLRGLLLMALSNQSGSLVLTTGNKSEVAVGYCTLYGDMVGGFSVLKDIFKTDVYRLARWRNRQSVIIPQRIIDRPPSAELRPEQTDQDSLPAYEVLDAILRFHIEDNKGYEEIVAMGFDGEVVRQVLRLVRISEYKRRQSPLGVRCTPRGFGRDWRIPATQHYRS